MNLPAIHRVVTGHNAQGDAIIVDNGGLPTVVPLTAIPGTVFHEVWATTQTPAPITRTESDPTLGALRLPPPRHGTRIRFVDVPPDSEDFLRHGAARMHDAFTQVGDAAASTVNDSSPHPLMHRTETIDYGIVIEGEVTLIVDDGAVLLKPGSVVIQRGTNHAWANRSGAPARMLFVLLDGQYESSLATQLSSHQS